MSTVPPVPPPPQDSTSAYSGYVDGTRASTIPDGVGFWPRAGARVIDTIAHICAGFAGGVVFGVLAAVATSVAGGDFQSLAARLGRSSWLDFVVGILGFLTYHTICEGLHGSSLGKMVLGQVVVTDQVRPCNLRAAFIRSLAYFVPDALVFGIPAYLEMQKTRLQKRHGDNWAGTFVARRTQVPVGSLRSTGRFLMVVTLGLGADAAIMMAYLATKLR
jgi:uncharacterized RDD family membrane protein YckC